MKRANFSTVFIRAIFSFAIVAQAGCAGSASEAGTALLTPLILIKDTASITANGQVTLSASGGAAPYTYAIASGSGSIDPSTGVFTSTAAGSVVATVTDATGAQSTLQFYVSSGSSTTSSTDSTTTSTPLCVGLGSSTLAQNDAGLEVAADFTGAENSAYVIVGIGARFGSNKATGLYVKLAHLGGDGTVSTSDTKNYMYGNISGTSRGEVYAELPAGYLTTGFGMASDSEGENVSLIKLSGVKLHSDGTLADSIECTSRTAAGKMTCASTVALPNGLVSAYLGFGGASTEALKGVGVGVAAFKVLFLYAKTQSIETSAEHCN